MAERKVFCDLCGDEVYIGHDYVNHLDLNHDITKDFHIFLEKAERQLKQEAVVSPEEESGNESKASDSDEKIDFSCVKEENIDKEMSATAFEEEDTQQLLKQAIEDFADEMFRDLKDELMLSPPSSKESFSHENDDLSIVDPVDAKLMDDTRAEIESAIDSLEISDDFFKYILDEKRKENMETKQKEAINNSEALKINEDSLEKKVKAGEAIKTDTKAEPEEPRFETVKKKTESRYRCCFPECHFILNKTQMKEGLKHKHLTKFHKLKPRDMKNKPAGTFNFPKLL